MSSDSLIIIPTYNEKENIENIIRAIFALEKPFQREDGADDVLYVFLFVIGRYDHKAV